MKAFGKVFAAGKFGGSGEVGGGSVGERAVDGAVNDVGLFADIFHDVDLAALRPADGVDVVAEHPERRPDALALRDFDAGFEAAESLREEPLSFQARGSVFAGDVITAFVIFFARGDDEIAVFDVRVLGAVGVGLEFVDCPSRCRRGRRSIFWGRVRSRSGQLNSSDQTRVKFLGVAGWWILLQGILIRLEGAEMLIGKTDTAMPCF